MLFQDYVCSRDKEKEVAISSMPVPISQPGKWLPGSNPMPVPDCSVVTHSDTLVAPTTLTLEVTPQQTDEETESSSICDDPTLLAKVNVSITLIFI